MKEAVSNSEILKKQGLPILYCDTTDKVKKYQPPQIKSVSSPIQCIHHAIEEKPEIILIRFGKIPIKEREALIDLCSALKTNSHTSDIPIMALLNSKHRKLLEHLKQADVNYARYAADDEIDPFSLKAIMVKLSPDDRVEKQLEIICPFLHYRKIDSIREMKVCGAHLDRMVLGGSRLHEICEIQEHLYCEYFQSQRVK